jgi:hypothetical protein
MSINNIVTDQGSSFTYTFTLQGAGHTTYDLTGFDARLQVRRSYGAAGSPLINCTIPNGKLVLTDAPYGVLTLNLLPTDTSSIVFNNKDDDTLEAVYDLELVSPTGKVYKPCAGTFTLNREVTR